MNDRHLTKAEVDAIADDLLAAEHGCPGSLPLSPEDQEAFDRIRRNVAAYAQTHAHTWWRRVWWRIRYGWTVGDTAAVLAWTALCGVAALAVGWLS